MYMDLSNSNSVGYDDISFFNGIASKRAGVSSDGKQLPPPTDSQYTKGITMCFATH